jgi:catechol 2,3-dioxygenase-like lactoylglutathione lyase family enzyme
MSIAAIDHWVLVVKDLEATFAFYRKLGLEAGWQERPGGRGKRPIIRISETQKLNLYVVDRYEIESPTHAPGYALGSADFCLRWEGTVQEAQDFLKQAGVAVLQEPAARSGALGPGTSLYVRDPDDNLIELITYGDPKYKQG